MTECPACGHDSDVVYRCEECGRDLVGEGEDVRTDGGIVGPSVAERHPTDRARGSDRDGRMQRVTVRLPADLLDRLDDAVGRGEYPSRSEAIRDALREVYGGGV